ncbi:hypothetical protein QBC44DRAFT_333090 [Cladorrhinum sp. PSN332]|nr:hypothetical protein QBC44DRAFT_333090 [Cladorrhinum sp. PSN332]
MGNNIVDPDGDVILTLEYPNDPFAPECGSPPTHTQSPDSTTLTKNDTSLDTLSSPRGIAESGEGDKPELVTFRVSSRHLALASPVFKSALTGGWKESVKIEGVHQINSQGWDTTALSIFLNAIHCQYRQVPRSLELEMLAKVAVIVDYYAAHQAIEILSPIWIDALRSRLPTTTCHNRTIALWICISWVFGNSSAFETATKVAIHHGRSNMTDFGLPIPRRVVEDINANQKGLVLMVFGGLSALQQDLLRGSKGCGVECRTMQLGALTRLLNSTSLLNYSPKNDYQALSVGQLLEEVKAAVCPTWYEMPEKKPDLYGNYNIRVPPTKPHECPPPGNAFGIQIKSIANSVNGFLRGLSITQYAKSATESK